MPWLDQSEPQSSAGKKVYSAIKNALLRRIPADQLTRAFRQLHSRYPTSPEEVARILLGFRAQNVGADDPLLFDYADILLSLGLLNVESLLVAILNTSRFGKGNVTDTTSSGLPTCEERMFNMLTQKYMTGALTIHMNNLHGLVFAFARWMRVTTDYEVSQQLQDGALHSADIFTLNLYEAFASLAITVLNSPAFRAVAKRPWWKKRRPIIVREMVAFDIQVLQWMQSQLAGRLQVLTTFPPFLESDEKGRPIFTDAQILQSIQDVPVSNSRAGLYIWLNACLYSRPFTDDSSMIMYLQTRSSGDIETLVVELLTASFDVLTNTFRRKESEQNIKVVRSFICNKLPTLLAIISSSMSQNASVETEVALAFTSITMDALPPISAGATEVREKLKVARLEFLQACMLHGIISESTAASILQEPPPPSKATKYLKDNLVAKYGHNIGSIDGLLDELNGMQGNAGAIARCIVEIVNNLCLNRDTISLKILCSVLIRKIVSVDIILQYTSTIQLLSPMCNQLNTWIHDQDQAEFTPAYEEFASILLFLFAVIHRYGLTIADLGLHNDETFVSKMLRDISQSYLPGDLTTEQNGQLAKWIEGLYTTDEQGEAGGIGDEVMRPCPAQSFFQLVPTLFEQSAIARKSGALSVKAFKGGLELLVEPFLLPSLVPGLSWLIKHSWEDHDDADVLLQMLEKLLKPSSTAQETRAMHNVILGIVADPLYHSLQNFNQKKPGKKEVGNLMDTLRPFLNQARTLRGTQAEVEEWTSIADGGLARCLQNTIKEQVVWVTTVGPTPPPKYTHKLFATACDTLGEDAVLDAIVAELRRQTKLGKGNWALDVCAAMICAPATIAPALLMSIPSAPAQPIVGPSKVRDALRLRTNNLQQLLQTSAESAESLVRLARRVDAQLVVTHVPQLDLPLPLPSQAADQIMADLGLTDGNMTVAAQDPVAIAAAGDDFNNADLAAVLDQQPLDMTDAAVQDLANLSADPNALQPVGGQAQDLFADLNMDIPPSLANPDGAGGENAEDDIFAGLDMSNMDDDFGFS